MKTHCAVCKKPINRPPSQIKQSKVHYCSRQCYQASGTPRGFKKTGVYIKCVVCNTSFYVPPVRKNTARYCSKKCKGIDSRLPIKVCRVCKKIFKPVMGRKDQPCCSRRCGHEYRKTGKIKQCAQCLADFYVPKHRANTRFCSRECANDWQSRNKTKVTCKTCGEEFRVSASRLKFDNPTYCSMQCRDNDPRQRNRLLKMTKRQQDNKPNSLERLGYSMLDDLGISYIPQHIMYNKFCVDAFVPRANTVIQFDGDYWHGHPDKFPNPDKRQLKRMALDNSQDAYLQKCGHTIIRIWETQLKKSPDDIKALLQRSLSACPCSTIHPDRNMGQP